MQAVPQARAYTHGSWSLRSESLRPYEIKGKCCWLMPKATGGHLPTASAAAWHRESQWPGPAHSQLWQMYQGVQ